MCRYAFNENIFCLDCLHGYYGYNCNNTCNSACKGCDAVNGLCNTGCMPGWRGDYCQEGKLRTQFNQSYTYWKQTNFFVLKN